MVDCEPKEIKINSPVKTINEEFSVITKEQYFGQVIDIYGNTIIDSGANQKKNWSTYPNVSSVFAAARGIDQRMNLDTQLETGIFAIDLLFPIGQGQRQLVLGDQQSGKTSLCLNTIIQQRNNPNMKMIFVSIGNRMIDLKKIYNTLKEKEAMHNTILLYAPGNNSMQQYLAPYVAMNHAENLCAAGFDVLVVVDNLTYHGNILREITLLTGLPVGKEAFSKTIFYDHASLLERAGKFTNGKTITCLPIVKTVNNNINGLLPSNIISITDGQIILDVELKNKGILPAIDLKRSVSRLGSMVQINSLRKNGGEIKKIYSLYSRYGELENVSFNFNDQIQTVINKGEMLMKVLKQAEFTNYSAIYKFILSMIVVYQLIPNTSELDEKIRFLNAYFEYSYLGQLLNKQFQKQVNGKIALEQSVIHNILTEAFEQYELMKKIVENPDQAITFPFNSQKFYLHPKA